MVLFGTHLLSKFVLGSSDAKKMVISAYFLLLFFNSAKEGNEGGSSPCLAPCIVWGSARYLSIGQSLAARGRDCRVRLHSPLVGFPLPGENRLSPSSSRCWVESVTVLMLNLTNKLLIVIINDVAKLCFRPHCLHHSRMGLITTTIAIRAQNV